MSMSTGSNLCYDTYAEDNMLGYMNDAGSYYQFKKNWNEIK